MLFRKIRFLFDADDGGAGGTPGDNPEETTEGGATQEKTFTQAELNGMLKKERLGSQKTLLQQLGVENIADVKTSLEAFREYQESQKDDLQKANDLLAQGTTKLGEETSRADIAEAKVAALIAGVDPKRIGQAMKLILTYDEETSQGKIDKFLEEWPDFLKAEGVEVPDQLGGPTGGQGKGAGQAAKEQVRTAMGL